MCGISGALDLKGSPINGEIILTMTDLLRHRGPDDGGVYSEGEIALGNRRLKIIDLSSAGHQPMSNENFPEKGQMNSVLWLTFNGEIYNYKQLRKELIDKGHHFHSNTDTETILHLYEDFGENCVEKLEGMFAFSIWDKNKNSLFIARDRLGEKPLLYTIHNNIFYFASEIKPLLSIPGFSNDINPSAVRQYFNFLYVSAPLSMFQKIKKLPPASVIKIFNGEIEIHQYWKPSYRNKFEKNEKNLVDELREHLDRTVNSRLMSDVPIGTMLSGGIDSTLISALTKKKTNTTLKTFSAFYEDEMGRDLDWEYAQLAAKKLDVEHFNVFYNADDLRELLPLAVKHYGEPHADIAALVSMYLSRFMKDHITVVLSGNGGDELFGGYNTYKKVSLITSPLVSLALNNLPSFPWDYFRKNFQKNDSMIGGNLAMVMYILSLKPGERKNYNIATDDEWICNNLFSDELKTECIYDVCEQFKEIFSSADSDNLLDSWLYADLMGRMQEYTVVQPDIAGMTYGIEIRAPFLNYELVEFAARIDPKLKVKRHRTTKYILRKAAEGIIPDEIAFRKLKTGFSGITYAHLIRLARDKWFDFFKDSLFNGTLQRSGFFNNAFIEHSWKILQSSSDFKDDTIRVFQILWSLVVFEHWMREVVLTKNEFYKR